MPFFSIITISLNAEKDIKPTLDSVLKQTFDDYEIIIKDGGSKDHTLDLIPKNKHIQIIQQYDTSLYDAMNQATAYARGKYLLFLNCGDILADCDVLNKIFLLCNKKVNAGVLYGNTFYVNLNKIRYYPEKLNNYFWYITTLCHQSVLFNRDYLNIPDVYDTKYKISADFDLLLKLYSEGVDFVHLNFIISKYEGGGISENPKGLALRDKEKKEILRKYFSYCQLFYFFLIHVKKYFFRKYLKIYE